jgi:Na+-translocating ferredoxin:NAD+ oxidoreductase subunit B
MDYRRFYQAGVMETQSVYQELARHLDSFPQGYPPTNSGVELKILAALFTEDEAKLGMMLPLDFTPLSRLVERTGWTRQKLRDLVKSMAGKGLINLRQDEGELEVMPLPFIVGFYENQRETMDPELAQFVEDYFHETNFGLLAIEPFFHRVIPVREAINTKIEILPESDIENLLSGQRAWAVIDCVCRKQQALLDRACEHPIRTCLVMSEQAHVFDNREDMDALSLPEALMILQQAADAGLVHTVANHREGLSYVCNCCTCGCGILRGIAEAQLANVVARSAYRAEIDAESCVVCGACETACQFNAVHVVDAAVIDPDVCVGCGLCARACPEGAIDLVLRQPEDILAVPDAYHDWMTARGETRKFSEI